MVDQTAGNGIVGHVSNSISKRKGDHRARAPGGRAISPDREPRKPRCCEPPCRARRPCRHRRRRDQRRRRALAHRRAQAELASRRGRGRQVLDHRHGRLGVHVGVQGHVQRRLGPIGTGAVDDGVETRALGAADVASDLRGDLGSGRGRLLVLLVVLLVLFVLFVVFEWRPSRPLPSRPFRAQPSRGPPSPRRSPPACPRPSGPTG